MKNECNCNCNKSTTDLGTGTTDVLDKRTDTDIVTMGVIEMPYNLYLAIKVMNGHFGNGEERANQLRKQGANPNEVQTVVNLICNLW